MRFGSLFSGVGGMDLGLERAGMTPTFMCEIDPRCRMVLRRHWPDVPCHDDVTTLDGATLPEVDLVAWGSPCQDLSVAGNRAGMAGERSGLFHEGMRVIREMREASDGRSPTWSVWENVEGALSSNQGRDFGVVIDAMADAGAVVVEWAVLDGQFFGPPQRRKRVFVVAGFDPARECPDPLLPVGSGSSGDSPTRGEAWEDAARRAEGGALVAQCHGNNVGPMGALRQGRGDVQSGVPFVIERERAVNALTGKTGGPDDNDAQAGHLIAQPRSSRINRAGIETMWTEEHG